MSYATPARFITDVDAEEATRLVLDVGRVLTFSLLLQAVGVAAGTGVWAPETTAPERVVAMAAHDTLVRKLRNASNYIDGYLRSANVTLPLPTGDANAGTLEDCCVALARDELAGDAGVSTEVIVERAERWRKWLRDVAAGRSKLILEGGEEVAASSSVRTGQAKTGFNWGAHSQGFGGYRK